MCKLDPIHQFNSTNPLDLKMYVIQRSWWRIHKQLCVVVLIISLVPQLKLDIQSHPSSLWLIIHLHVYDPTNWRGFTFINIYMVCQSVVQIILNSSGQDIQQLRLEVCRVCLLWKTLVVRTEKREIQKSASFVFWCSSEVLGSRPEIQPDPSGCELGQSEQLISGASGYKGVIY